MKFINASEARLYLGWGPLLMYQRIYGATIDERHLIVANGIAVAQYTTRLPSPDELRYFYRDALGSITLIANEAGNATDRLSYDAHGKRRFPSGADDPNNSVNPIGTDLGFTGHEQLDEIGMIHMNGRLYDPRLGRFVSADPIGESNSVPGGLNRYSYVLNNPFKYIDPTGYTGCNGGLILCWVLRTLGLGFGDNSQDSQEGRSDNTQPNYRDFIEVAAERIRRVVGNGLGATGGLTGGASDAGRSGNSEPECNVGQRAQAVFGFNASLVVPSDTNYRLSDAAGVAISVTISQDGQIAIQRQNSSGYGYFAGAFVGVQAGLTSGNPLRRGQTARSTGSQMDANVAFGPGGGGSVAYDDTGGNTYTVGLPIARFNAGIGAASSLTDTQTTTTALNNPIIGPCSD